MPTPIDIEFFNIAKTVVDKDEVKRWLDHVGAESFEIPDDGAVSNPALLIALAAKRCYMSFEAGLNPNVTKVRKDYVDYFDNILGSGHGSVLEHSVFTFALEGVSRVFTAEMNRHRAGWAISEGSLRFIRFGDNIPYWVPDSIKGDDVIDPPDGIHEFVEDTLELEFYGKDGGGVEPHPQGTLKDTTAYQIAACAEHGNADPLEVRKQITRQIFMHAFMEQEAAYRLLQAVWDMDDTDKNFGYKKKVTSMMRRIVGLGVATGGVWSGNVRALRHVLTMRCAPAAEEEILHVFSRIAKRMRDQEPLLFGDFYQDEDGYWRPKYVKV